jgi:DNA-binding MarR family transcriptional regulator
VPRTPTQAWRPQGGTHLSILFDVFALGQRVRTLVTTAMRGAGLRPDEYAAYSVVFEDGPMTMSALARTLGMPLTTAADYVRTMVERGHAWREAHPSDQRATVLTLTAEGLRVHRRASRAFDRAYQALARELTVDEGAAREMLQALADSVARAGAALVPGSPARGGRTTMHD